MILQPGDIIDRYVVDAFVGQGGLAEVYSVRHRVLDTRHALKVLRHATHDQADRLVREGRAQAHIDHPNVVPVRDVLEVGGAPALLMPLVEGPSLRDLLHDRQLHASEAAALFRDIVAGVRHVHERGLVHRDLKPGNVLLEVKGRTLVPRVADFGLVKDSRSANDTMTEGFMGTPAYASPEQLQARSTLDARTDLWALGVMLYEMLCGDLPFTEMDLLALARGDDSWRLRIDPVLEDKGWGELLTPLLAIDREARTQSCAEIDDALDALGVSPTGMSAWLALDAPLAAAVLEMHRPAADPPGSLGRSTRVSDLPTFSPAALHHASNRAFHTVTEPGALNNVAQPLNAIIGREEDLALVESLLDTGTRITTLTGPAGAGKTRLAVELVLRGASLRQGGAWLAALDAASDADAVCSVVARALGLQGVQTDTEAEVGRELARRGNPILILDNAEHVLSHVSAALVRWVEAAPGAQFILTSRLPVELPGEQVVRLAPLSLPAGDELGEAAQLFLDRARRVDARFTLQPGDEQHLRAIVAELDGLPLAIELAAARVRLLSLKAIRDRLDRRFALLSAHKGRDSTSRQTTLRGALDSSWDLLHDWEKDALMQLSAFAAPFTLEDAEAVVDLFAWPDAPLAMDAVANLVDHSLVQVQQRRSGEDEPRFRLLVSIREYARQKLADAEAMADTAVPDRCGPDAVIALERRHGEYFGRWGVAMWTSQRWSRTPAQTMALAQAADDLVVACERALARGDGEIAARAAIGASQYCTTHGPVSLALDLLERVQNSTTLSDETRLRVLTELGSLHLFIDSAESPRAFRKVLEEARASGDISTAARALRGLAHAALERGELGEAEALLNACNELFGGAPSGGERAQLAFSTALLRIHQVRNDEAEALLSQAAEWADVHQEHHFRGVIASWRHVLFTKQGRGLESRGELEAALLAAIQEGHAVNHARYLRSLALLDRLSADPGTAVRRMRDAIAVQSMVSPGSMPAFTLHLAMALLEAGDVEGARGAFVDYPIGEVHDANAAWMSRALSGRAIIAGLEGDRKAFETDVAAALDAATRTGVRAVDAQIAAYRGLGLVALGDAAGATVQLTRAQQVADELGIHPGSVEGHEIAWLRESIQQGAVRTRSS